MLLESSTSNTYIYFLFLILSGYFNFIQFGPWGDLSEKAWKNS